MLLNNILPYFWLIIYLIRAGIDAGGIFNDSLNKVFEKFLEMKDIRFGGDSSFFIGEYSKTVSESVIVEFVEEVKVFYNLLIFNDE